MSDKQFFWMYTTTFNITDHISADSQFFTKRTLGQLEGFSYHSYPIIQCRAFFQYVNIFIIL